MIVHQTDYLRIEIAVNDIEDSKKLACLALDNDLYVSGWRLRNTYSSIANGYETYNMAVLLIDDIPVASCLIGEENTFASYTKPSHRNMGFGRMLIQHLLEYFPDTKGHVNGSKGCDVFFTKSGCSSVINMYR